LRAQNNRIEIPPVLLKNSEEWPYRKDRLQAAFAKEKWKNPVPLFANFTLHDFIRNDLEQSAKSNFFGTKFSQSLRTEYSYELHAEGMKPIDVTVNYNFSEKLNSSIQPIDDFPLEFGDDELLYRKLYVGVFMGFMNENRDPWMLLIGSAEGSESANEYRWVMTNGKRNIDIELVKNEVKSQWKQGFEPFLDIPRGFVFREKEKPLGAMQVCTYNRKKHSLVWMDKDLDKEFQMALSASMSSLLLLLNDSYFMNQVISPDWF
jgi:hypothetical protein